MAASQGALLGRESYVGSSLNAASPTTPRRICCPRVPASRGHAALQMRGWDLVVWFGRSHSERSHLHPESSSKSSLQPKSQHYPILVHLRLSRPFRGPGKNSEIPTAGTPTRARVSGCLGRGLTPQFPWGSYERGRDAGREGSLKRKNTPLARRCPVSTAPVITAPMPESAGDLDLVSSRC
jgi:hypothetical protein